MYSLVKIIFLEFECNCEWTTEWNNWFWGLRTVKVGWNSPLYSESLICLLEGLKLIPEIPEAKGAEAWGLFQAIWLGAQNIIFELDLKTVMNEKMTNSAGYSDFRVLLSKCKVILFFFLSNLWVLFRDKRIMFFFILLFWIKWHKYLYLKNIKIMIIKNRPFV